MQAAPLSLLSSRHRDDVKLYEHEMHKRRGKLGSYNNDNLYVQFSLQFCARIDAENFSYFYSDDKFMFADLEATGRDFASST